MREKLNFREFISDITIDFGDIKMLTISQAAKFLQCDKRMVKKLIKQKKLPAVDIGTGDYEIYRIHRDSLIRYLIKE